MIVFVINKHGEALMPCSNRKAKNRWNDGDSSGMLVSVDTSTEKLLPLGGSKFTNKILEKLFTFYF